MSLHFTKEHEWIRVEGDQATVGITDFAQGQLGDVVFVEVPEAGRYAAGILFLYELWLIRRRRPEACFQAFNNNHYVGMVVFIGLALDYLYRGT